MPRKPPMSSMELPFYQNLLTHLRPAHRQVNASIQRAVQQAYVGQCFTERQMRDLSSLASLAADLDSACAKLEEEVEECQG